ncbi:hypothetical protein L3Q82_004479 [Scortum barcoo]|uniref:Uncharacterized protein n=1 Tax=Scortum barcoo TaxID=214431 RepID=A0ACB8VJY3_9TELE|nr:hypothetical protein L3Q82_004479 [Scortum barcoo]
MNTMFEHKGVHQCIAWHQDTLGRRSMIDFVVAFHLISGRISVFGHSGKERGCAVNRSPPPGGELDPLAEEEVEQTWQTQTYCEGLLGTPLAEPSVREVFNSHLRKSFSQIPWEAGDHVLCLHCRYTWQFEVVDIARSLVPVCHAPNPVVVTGSKGCRQAEEGVLLGHVGLWDS